MMSLARIAAKQSPPKSRIRSGKPRRVGRKQQIGPVVDDHLLRIDHGQQAGLIVDLVRIGVQFVGHQCAQFLRHRRIDLKMDHHAAAAALQRGLVGADKVFRLFLELHVGVADQPEQPAAVDA